MRALDAHLLGELGQARDLRQALAQDALRARRPCRYLARRPIATERLSLAENGRVVYALRRHWKECTRAFAFDPLDIIAKLAALVPRPRTYLMTQSSSLSSSPRLDSVRLDSVRSEARARGFRQLVGLHHPAPVQIPAAEEIVRQRAHALVLEPGQAVGDLVLVHALIAVRIQDAQQVGACLELALVESLVPVAVELLHQILAGDPGRQKHQFLAPRGPFRAGQHQAAFALERVRRLDQEQRAVRILVERAPFGVLEAELARRHMTVAVAVDTREQPGRASVGVAQLAQLTRIARQLGAREFLVPVEIQGLEEGVLGLGAREALRLVPVVAVGIDPFQEWRQSAARLGARRHHRSGLRFLGLRVARARTRTGVR
ncbi:MAG: hypothetical protein HOP15_15795, partial [Planctomycetes bacterium]|nr:hypothetical protein [Planctomycetota bacterium]